MPFLTFQLIVTDDDVFMFSEILYIIFTQPDQVLQCSKCGYKLTTVIFT